MMSEDKKLNSLQMEVMRTELRAANIQARMVEREARASEDKERRERFKSYGSFWQMVWWDREVGGSVLALLGALLFAVLYFWEEILSVVPWVFLALVILGIGVVATLRTRLLDFDALNPLTTSSRTERLRRRRERRIQRITGGAVDHDLTDAQRELKAIIEGHYNVKIGRLLDRQ